MIAWTRRQALSILAVGLAATTGMALASTSLETEVDFVDAVPDHDGLASYRALLSELDGVHFLAIYHAHDTTSGTDHLRGEAFDALVMEQARLGADLRAAFPGMFSHELNVAEAMRAGNYMLEKMATGGQARPESYALPSDPVRYQAVRDQALAGDSLDAVLAPDGSSALSLWFVTARDSAAARVLALDVNNWLADWAATSANHPTTTQHALTGLLWARAYTDQVNREETTHWGILAGAAVALSLLWVLRRPSNVLLAVVTLAVALVWTYGTMALLGIRISFLTAFLAPVVIGIGIDYAVHLLHRFDEQLARGDSVDGALMAALAGSGPAVALAALTTAAGLAVLLLVPAPLFAEIGGVAAIGILMAALATFTITPALRRLLPARRSRRHPARRAKLSWWMRFGDLPPRATILILVAITAVAGTAAATGTEVASGSAQNEFPQDDPTIELQQRIESEYGAFARAYLVVEGPMDRAQALQAIHDATLASHEAPLWRDATSVADVVLADRATDQGAVDVGLSTLLTPAGQPSPAAGLPATDEEARASLDALFADPLWRTIAPFTISRDYQLAVVAVTLDPWQTQGELQAVARELRAQAATLQGTLGDDYHVAAAGGPLNRHAIVEQTPSDVALATIGTTAVVFVCLATAWRRRPRGVLIAAAAAGTVLVAALWLLATIPVLDAWYAWGHGALGWPANSATLNDMFLLAFAITVAAGIDDWVHFAHRTWSTGSTQETLRTTGRALTGTTLTTTAAFATMAGIYFLQSKNLAILTAVGVASAYLLTMAVAPVLMRGAVATHADGRGPSPTTPPRTTTSGD